MKHLTLVLLLSLWANVTFSQSDTTTYNSDLPRYVNALSTVPAMLVNWLNSIDKISQRQDREKLTAICKDLLAATGALRVSKQTLIARIDLDPHTHQYHNAVSDFKKKVNALNDELTKSEPLAKSITGVSAITTINDFRKDISLKELYLDIIYMPDATITKDQARNILRKNLAKGVVALKDSEKVLKQIIHELEQE